MNKEDIKGFFAEESDLDLEKYVIQTYWFETSGEPDVAAAALCSEQSTAQWKRAGIDEDLRPVYAAKVVSLDVLSVSHRPAFESPFNKGEKFSRCRVRIAHPHHNFGPKIPNLLTAACGEGAFFTRGITAIKLLDIAFPESFIRAFEGPKFGVEGIRKLLGVYDRPIFMGVVKPNIGLDPLGFAELAYQAWLGGLDIAKDDEMLSDSSYSPLARRLELLNIKRCEAEKTTGEKKIFLANITDEVDQLIRLHDLAVQNGAGAVMVNGMTTGLSALRMLRKHTQVPLVGHFDFIAPFSRIPFFGVSSVFITKLQRLAGCDAIVMPGFGARMMTEDEEVEANVDACLKSLGSQRRILPVPGGSDWAGTLPIVYEKLRTIDFGFIPGRGIFGHPRGPAAGAKSIHQAWQAIVSRIPLEEYAKGYVELREAVEIFGRGKVPKSEERYKTTQGDVSLSTFASIHRMIDN
jgi:ribulose-bisphosphate carboxylase large chain